MNGSFASSSLASSCTQEYKILSHSLSFFLGLLHHFLLFLLLAGNLSPYLDAEKTHTLQPKPCQIPSPAATLPRKGNPCCQDQVVTPILCVCGRGQGKSSSNICTHLLQQRKVQTLHQVSVLHVTTQELGLLDQLSPLLRSRFIPVQ